MIRLAAAGDTPAIARATAHTPGLGPRLWATWCIQRENPRYPGAIYLCENTGGKPAPGEDLPAFLDMMNVRYLRTLGWLPPGWRDVSDTPLLLANGPLNARAALARSAHAAQIEEDLPASAVAAVLTSAGILAMDAQAQNDFLSYCNTHRNHGQARVLGLRQNGRLVATAGAYSMTDGDAYIASVATLPEHHGRGYAAALLAHLQSRLGGRMMSLFSLPHAVGFYTRLGFTASPVRRVTAVPGKDDASCTTPSCSACHPSRGGE